LSKVQYRNDSIVINKDGKPVAALVDAELFARIRRMRERFETLSNRIASCYSDVPIEQGMAEIEAAVISQFFGGYDTGALTNIIGIIVGIFYFVFSVVVSRVLCELLMVIFKINEHTQGILKHLDSQ
jgi:prevent-host-death family protein